MEFIAGIVLCTIMNAAAFSIDNNVIVPVFSEIVCIVVIGIAYAIKD